MKFSKIILLQSGVGMIRLLISGLDSGLQNDDFVTQSG